MATPRKPAAKAATQNRAARRSQATKKASQVRSVPEAETKAQGAKYTLDELEAESRSDVEPFVLELSSGEDITLGDPTELDYAVLATADVEMIFAQSMSDEDYDKFLEEGFTGRQVATLLNLWRRHYGLLQPGE